MTPTRSAALALALLAGPATAETASFRVLLGGGEVGTLAWEGTGEREGIRARFAGTPLSVADGTFVATSQPATTPEGAVVRQYLSESDFTTGDRVVSILSDGEGGVLSVVIDPAGDLTAQSDPAQVPAGTLDAAQAFGRLAAAEGCPAPFRLFDGRRLVEVTLAPAAAAAGQVACSGAYRVVAGPGHLSPLGISSFSLDLLYDVAGGEQWLAQVEVRTGPFVVRLVP